MKKKPQFRQINTRTAERETAPHFWWTDGWLVGW